MLSTNFTQLSLTAVSQSNMPQLFNPIFRHLWYLSGWAMLGMLVLAFAYEKLNGATSGVAILGFTAALVHASAWWFSMGVIAPWKKFLFCGMLFGGLWGSAFFGRLAYLWTADQELGPLLEHMTLIACLIPPWWFSLVVINEIAKRMMRWKLTYDREPLTPPPTIGELFQLTAIVGAIVAVSKPTVETLIDSDYTATLLLTMLLHTIVLLPLTAILLRARKRRPALSIPTWSVIVTIFVLLAMTLTVPDSVSSEVKMLTDAIVGILAWFSPLLVMLLSARENQLGITSQWSRSGSIEPEQQIPF